MDIQKIGDNIKEYRKQNNILQREFAEKLYVTDKAVSRWECGKSFPDLELLPKIAEILGITVGELLGETVSQSDDELVDKYKEECERLKAECDSLKTEIAKTERQKQIVAQKRKKIFSIFKIVAIVCFVAVVSVGIAFICYKPKYTLTLVNVTANGSDTVKIKQGEKLPTVDADGKTLLGFIDENYNYYTQSDFCMPRHNVTLRALLKEDMPLFTPSDSKGKDEIEGEHILTDDGTPATKYVFAANSEQGTFVQSRPVSDSGSMQNINVYAPSLGKRFMLMSVKNGSNIDVKIKYRVENNSDKVGGLDYYTPTVEIKANTTTLVPVYFESAEAYGVFDGCDHFIVLDQDVDEDVELTVFGHIYTADELYGVKIISTPHKFFYEDGEQIDLSGLQVQAQIKDGSKTGTINLTNYECDARGKNWNSDTRSLTVSFGGKTDTIEFFGLDEYKLAFAPAVNFRSLNDDGDYITAQFTTASDGMPASRFTVASGAKSGAEVEAWIIEAVEEAKNDGINLRIPTFTGETRRVQLVVTNEGGEEVSFYYYAEDLGDRGGVEITVAPNQTKSVWFNVNSQTSIGCNYAFRLLNDVQTETTLVINGYFYCKNELSGISVYKDAEQATFNVGEAFNSQGLVVKAEGNGYDDVVIANYATDCDGYTFTNADIGKKTVTVKFEKFTVQYEIEIVGG